jgi:hypothetical protein
MHGMRYGIVLMALGMALGACVGPGPFKGNDTGGIIAWSPEAEASAREVTASHCSRYGRQARITSIRREYGDYIAFSCL